ncbi:MAG: peptidylprolyl isomerase [Bacteroidales bacterium]|nr:peptidylprolyl isomerase [Bacteroidales bacterium]MBN2763397.1 peptidylprolyl isomerase [Bacteroidales bacterium]
MKGKYILLLSLMISVCIAGKSQVRMIDQIIAVVGDKRILYSDIEEQFYQLAAQGEKTTSETRCEIFEQLLIQKLLLNQAEVDSIEITESQVDAELDARMRYFVNMMGSEQKLEEYFKKSTLEIKEDFRHEIYEQMLTNRMRGEITGSISITPSEVRNFYRSLPQDEIPYVESEVEISQITVYPKYGETGVFEVREKLLDIRQRIVDGENFATLAVLYSEDPGSATRGGDIGWVSKSDVDPEYAKAAFGLKKGAVSKIVESSFGYHIIQCIDRMEDRVHTRHILMRPKLTPEIRQQEIERLDSIVFLIKSDSLSFEKAALIFSEDKDTKLNGGQVVNPKGGARWNMDELNPQDYSVIKNMNVGDLSSPFESIDNNRKTVFKIMLLKKRTNPHVANPSEDYNLLKEMTMEKKQEEIITRWVEDKIRTTYIRIEPEYRNCNFSVKGWLKS